MLVAAVWWAYDAVNNLNPLRETTALAHGLSIVNIETWLHLDAERGLNRWLADHLLLGRWVGDYYALAHFVITVAVLVWLWWRHPGRYRLLRNALLGINVIGFLVFWAFPVAPPRMLSGLGFVDIDIVAHSLGNLSTGALAHQANEYAAMPSLHVAWALWCAFAVWAIRTDRPARAGAAGYVILTSVVAMATGHHYFLDVVAGATTAVVAGGAVALAHWRSLGPTEPTVSAAPAA